MIIAKQYLYIEDKFQHNRAEWILGIGCLNSLTSNIEELPKLGVSQCSYISDEVYIYICPFELSGKVDSLLSLLCKYRGKMDLYVVNCLNILFEIIVGSQFLSEYMFNLDPLTYEYARFTDWIRPYLKKELEKAYRTMSTYNKTNKKEESIKKCFRFLEIYEKKLENYDRKLQGLPEEDEPTKTEESKKETDSKEETKESSNKEEEDKEEEHKVIRITPKRYLINCVTRKEEIHREEREDGNIKMIVYKVFCEIAESQPTCVGNNTLPGYSFHNAN